MPAVLSILVPESNFILVKHTIHLNFVC